MVDNTQPSKESFRKREFVPLITAVGGAISIIPSETVEKIPNTLPFYILGTSLVSLVVLIVTENR